MVEGITGVKGLKKLVGVFYLCRSRGKGRGLRGHQEVRGEGG